MTRSERGVDQVLEPVAAEYAAEEQAAAEEEARDAAASAVVSVRLPPAVYRAVRTRAAQAHLSPSALIRQWISERADEAPGGELVEAVTALRRDVARVASLLPPTGRRRGSAGS